MTPTPRPHDVVATTPHLLVCIGPNCSARGAGEMFSQIWAGLERDGLAYYKSTGSVRCTASGCLGACGEGPTVAAYPNTGPPQWWIAMTVDETLALARRLHDSTAQSAEPGPK